MKLNELWHTLGARLRRLLGRRRLERDLDDEMAFHLEMLAEKETAAGATPREAGYAAQRRFGNPARIREDCRDAWIFTWLEGLYIDMKQVLRFLRRNPGFTAAALLSLTLGIGANTAMFSVVYNIFMKPLPWHEPDRILRLSQTLREGFPGSDLPLSRPVFDAWRQNSTLCSGVAAVSMMGSGMTLTGAGPAEHYESQLVSSNFFSFLGVAPVLGRTFFPDEDRPGHARAALMSHVVWLNRFGGDPAVIGKTLLLSGEEFTVIGVMPAGFALPAWTDYAGRSNRADFWLPLNPDKDVNGRFMGVFARMKPGVTPPQVASELSALSANIDNSTRAAARPMATIYDSAKFTLTLLFVITALVWLLATANVANMALARATARVRESGLRAALGAGTWRIARQFILENMTLTAVAGILSLLLAHVVISILRHLQPGQFMRLEELRLDWMVLGFTLLLALLTAVATGFLPALQVARMEIMAMLGASGARSGDRPFERRSREALIVLQVALALILLVGTGLLARSLSALSAIDPGIDASNVLTFKVKTPEAWPRDKQEGFFTQLLQSIDALPGVESVAYTAGAPPLEGTSSFTAKIANSRTAPNQMLLINYRAISLDYFRTFGIPLLSQNFTKGPAAQGVIKVFVSETLARQHWPGENLVGLEWSFTGEKQVFRIVGVVKDVKDNGIRNPRNLLEIYMHVPGNSAEMVIGVRTNGAPMGYAAAVRQAVQAVNPDVAPYEFRTMEQVVGKALGSDRFLTGFLGVFAAIALCLALIGIYGVVSYVVSRRAKEIGIRMALGATPWRIYRTLGRRYLVVTVIGLAAGLGASILLTGLIRGLLYKVTPYDAGTLAGASLLLLLTALLAVWLPVRRVVAADPMRALNSD